MIYFTSDTHFSHANAIKFDSRPFKDVKEMNQAMIDNWNSVVNHEDTVYHLGDFGFGKRSRLEYIFACLNGTKHLILGNHDKHNDVHKFAWDSVNDYLEINHRKTKMVLFHYPIGSWNKLARGAMHLHGHSHGNYSRTGGRMLDVGVNMNNYYPISIDGVYNKLENIEPVYLDHHRIEI